MAAAGGGETERTPSALTVDVLAKHLDALRELDDRLALERDRRYAEVAAERDRRLSEVAVEREKALKIKETADLAALQLAREIQTYKDEKANELREQINSERGLYVTKDELATSNREVMAVIKPLSEFVAAQQGRGRGLDQAWGYLLGLAGLAAAVVAVIVAVTR